MNYLYAPHLSQSKFLIFTPAQKFASEINNDFYTIIFNRGKDYEIILDGLPFTIQKNAILTFTPSDHFVIERPNENLIMFRFNDGFYCVEKHDKEVGCAGYIFYGSSNISSILLDEDEQRKFSLLLEMFEEEFQNQDNIQGEMLTVLLKRLIIKCTRLARKQQYGESEESSTISIIRHFNILVQLNFKTEHAVNFYAKQLNISAKRLSKILLDAKQPSPISLIHSRIMTEARRQILISDKSIKEIAYELNFTDIQTFSRFFKSKQGISPDNFKKRKIAN